MEPFIGEIRIFPWGQTPQGWMPCNGQLLPIAQNQALYSLLSTTYGGNGSTNFALPDLRGRAMMNSGVSTTATVYQYGKPGGSESVVLTANQIPPHNHNFQAMNSNGTAALNNAAPMETLAIPAINGVTGPINSFTNATTPLVALAASTIANNAGGAGHENRVPLLALNICIAIQGLYPSRP